MEVTGKIVNFSFCVYCAHYDCKDDESPCHECLNEPGGIDQRKPMYFKLASDDVLEKRFGTKLDKIPQLKRFTDILKKNSH